MIYFIKYKYLYEYNINMNKKSIREENLKIIKLMKLNEAATSVGGVKQLIYNPLGYGYTNGGKYRSGFRVSNHDNHLHIGFSNRDVAIKILEKSMSMGLRTSENPYTFGKPNGDPTGKVERVHVSNSDHYWTFNGSPTVGGAVDISGDSNKIKELVKWIETEFGGDFVPTSDVRSGSGSGSGSGSPSDEGPGEKFDTTDSGAGAEKETKQSFKDLLLDPFLNTLFGKDKKDKNINESMNTNETFSFPSDSITKTPNLDKKTVTFSVIENRKVIAPCSGKIITADPSDCSGKIQIKTTYDGELHTVTLCGVTPRVNVGRSVMKGDLIGATNSKKLEMEILNDNNKKVTILPFFTDTQTSGSKTSKDKTGYDAKYKDDKGPAKPINVSDIPGDLIVAPLSLAGKLLGGIYNQMKSQNLKALNHKTVKEDITRMKKLMK